MSRAVIFDWGGVFMQTLDYERRHKFDIALDLEPGSVEGIVHGIPEWQAVQRGEIDLDTYWQAVGRALGLSPSMLDSLRKEFYAGDRLDEDVLKVARSLKENGVLLGLMSNNTLDLHETINDLGLDDLFDVRVISAEIGALKPDPRTYREVLDRIGVIPEQALFVDDFVENVEGAQAVGMAAVHFRPGMDLMGAIERWMAGG